MPARPLLHHAAVVVMLMLLGGSAWAASPRAAGAGAVLPGASSKEPISVDAAKLDYFDKEQKLVYSGDVVARQGESTLKGSVLTIFLGKDARKGADGSEADRTTPGAGSSIDRMEVRGPVTLISKDEVGTGDNGSYDKGENRVTLVGNVTLTQATNVIKGDKLVYDMTSGQAQVTSGQTQGRVKSIFTPGSSGGVPKKPKAPGPKAGPTADGAPQAAAAKAP